MDKFVLKAPYQPTGDQPQAIEALVKGFREGNNARPYWGLRGPVRRSHTRSRVWH